MSLREVDIRRTGNRESLFMGADRELGMCLGVVCGVLMFAVQEAIGFVVGALLWVIGMRILRAMAKADPKMRYVYLRHRKYPEYLPAQSTPYRDNTPLQGSRYK